jgi:hypothetical protein
VSCLIVFGHSDASGQGKKRAVPETERAEQKAREQLNRKGITDEQIKKAKAAWDLNPPQTPKAKGVAIRPAGKFDQFEKQPPKGRIALKGSHEPDKFSLSTPSAKPESPAKNAENKEHIPANHLNTHPHHGHHIHHTHSQPEGVCGSKNSPIPAEKCKLAGEDFNKQKPQN